MRMMAVAIAPDLLRHEVRSLILNALRRERLVNEEVPAIFRRFEALPVRVALAERRPLASFDKRLRAAAAAEGLTALPEALPS